MILWIHQTKGYGLSSLLTGRTRYFCNRRARSEIGDVPPKVGCGHGLRQKFDISVVVFEG